MTRLFKAIMAGVLIFAPATGAWAQSGKDAQQGKRWSLVLHGGAGTISRDKITQEKDAEIRAVLTRALDAGSAVLAQGGTSMDAVVATIMVLEDDPNFNAGKGAVFTWEGTNSLDSSIMDGATRDAGAAAGTSTTKNPILLARAVMENSPHVLLSGEGADQFSREQGLEQVDNSYFATPSRREALERFKLRANAISAVDDSKADGNKASRDLATGDHLGRDWRFGTVGAVAVDNDGNIAAGTSTGGTTGKRWGRIGDSPLIGAGTYADNRSCGVSATGAGEYFIRVGVALEICTRLRIAYQTQAIFTDETPQEIADAVIAEMGALGGDGGIIYATPWGQTGYSFDTPGMYRGRANSNGEKSVAIYGDEE